MKTFLNLLKTTGIADVFLVEPSVCVLLIFRKAIEISRILVKPIVKELPLDTKGRRTVTILRRFTILVFICLIPRSMAKTQTSHLFNTCVEATLLLYTCGYDILKGMAARSLRNANHTDPKLIVLGIEETWYSRILIDSLQDEL